MTGEIKVKIKLDKGDLEKQVEGAFKGGMVGAVAGGAAGGAAGSVAAGSDIVQSLVNDLFKPFDAQRLAVNQAVDKINQNFGEFTIAPANLLNRSSMPNVIAPSWKPKGIKNSI